MIDQTFWHPVAESAAVAGAAPLAARLLGQDVVLWRDAAGQAHVFADRCPHRGTRLSLGRVVHAEGKSTLECAYHGWQFERQGLCVLTPSLPSFAPPASHRACRYESHEAYGLVWARLLTSDSALPLFEAESDARLRKLLCGPYDVKTSAPRVVENFLDLSHFGFVHDGVLGDRDHLLMPHYRVETTAHGFVTNGCQAWQPQSNRLAAEGMLVDYHYELTAPFSAVLSKLPQGQDGYEDVIGLFVCPIDPEFSRVWFRLAITDFQSSDAALRAFQDEIIAADLVILESQSPK
ncbi:MAG TPA: aromatic ring-hydroxylating dioxygenase subunit alpha, partial [Rhizobacter sp.]|nr:aromatic ring-hydroxylating dioxygenase subunit alpha [Rhizobacter sp.]